MDFIVLTAFVWRMGLKQSEVVSPALQRIGCYDDDRDGYRDLNHIRECHIPASKRGLIVTRGFRPGNGRSSGRSSSLRKQVRQPIVFAMLIDPF